MGNSTSGDGLHLLRLIGDTPDMREMSVAEQRYQAVLAVTSDGETVRDVAARFGVSRKTVHGWLARYEAGGLENLGDHWSALGDQDRWDLGDQTRECCRGGLRELAAGPSRCRCPGPTGRCLGHRRGDAVLRRRPAPEDRKKSNDWRGQSEERPSATPAPKVKSSVTDQPK
jgi:hypothetical protein